MIDRAFMDKEISNMDLAKDSLIVAQVVDGARASIVCGSSFVVMCNLAQIVVELSNKGDIPIEDILEFIKEYTNIIEEETDTKEIN